MSLKSGPERVSRIVKRHAALNRLEVLVRASKSNTAAQIKRADPTDSALPK
jgi:hypothetical protein